MADMKKEQIKMLQKKRDEEELCIKAVNADSNLTWYQKYKRNSKHRAKIKELNGWIKRLR